MLRPVPSHGVATLRRVGLRGTMTVGLWSALLASAVVGPMAGKGWVVLLDWATGPRVAFADRILAGTSLPAGPVFFGAAALVHLLAGPSVGWLVPWLTLFVAAVGAARLASRFVSRLPALLTASTAYAWNPFVHERLYSGQLAVLLGYSMLPFVMTAALDIRNTGPVVRRVGPRSLLALPLAWAVAAASSIHFVVLGGIVVFATAVAEIVSGEPPRFRLVRRFLLATVITTLVTVAWLGPRLADAPPTGNDRTITAFATRPDPQLGLSGGVALQRGFWRPSPGEPSSARGWWWPSLGGALGGAAIVGLSGLWRSGGRRVVVAAVLIGLTGWLFGQGGAGMVGLLFRVFTGMPGMRIMREAGKFISLVSLTWTVGLAACAEQVCRKLERRSARWALGPAAMVVSLAPVVLSPGLGWGVGGRLAAVRYPKGWAALAGELDRNPSGLVIVLPFTGYYDPGFTNHRVVKHPGGVYFGSRVVLSDDSQIEGLPPSPRTATIAAALSSADPSSALGALGIGWVVGVAEPTPIVGTGFQRVFTSGEWSIYRILTFSGEAASTTED